MRRRATAALLLGGAVLGGCGVPPPGTSATIPATQLPYGLDQRAARPTTPAALPSLAQGPAVWLVRDSALVPVAAPRVVTDSTDPKAASDAMIARLANGPNEADLGAGYRTALGPTMTLHLLRVDEGVAVVELNPGDSGPGGASQLPLAAGQVVLTLTSVPGVESVRIEQRGRPLSVPLPSGVLTTRALTEDDYLPLVDSTHIRQPVTPTAQPTR